MPDRDSEAGGSNPWVSRDIEHNFNERRNNDNYEMHSAASPGRDNFSQMLGDSDDVDDRFEEIVYGNPCWTLKKSASCALKLILMITMLSITAILIYIFNTDHPIARDVVMFIIMNEAAAPFILTGINILITLFFLPGVFGALLCGYAYWFLWANVPFVIFAGTLTCFIGFSIGSVIAMYIGRYLIKGCIDRIHEKNKYLKALSWSFEKKGLKILILLRLSPLIPYNLLNYLAGAYPVKLWQFWVANLGMVPGIVVYVYVGTAVSSMGALFDQSGSSSLVKLIMFGIGIVFAIAAIVVIWIYTKKQLNKIMHEMDDIEPKVGLDQEESPHGQIINPIALENISDESADKNAPSNQIWLEPLGARDTNHLTAIENSKSNSRGNNRLSQSRSDPVNSFDQNRSINESNSHSMIVKKISIVKYDAEE